MWGLGWCYVSSERYSVCFLEAAKLDSWEICMQVKKKQLELDMEQQTSSRSGKVYVKAVTLLFNFNAEYLMRNAGLDEAQAGIKMLGEISITSDMQMTPPLWQKVKKT